MGNIASVCLEGSGPQFRAFLMLNQSVRVGKTAEFATDGSSRNLKYNGVPSMRGMFKLVSAKPRGIETVRLNSGSAATESSRKSLAPISVHCSSGFAGHRISFNDGVRTRVARGCQ